MKFWQWRKMSWLLWAWSIFFGVRILGGLSSLEAMEASETEAEAFGLAIGAGITLLALGVVWFMGFVVLSLIWLMTQPRDYYRDWD
jgi:hypothetical protein